MFDAIAGTIQDKIQNNFTIFGLTPIISAWVLLLMMIVGVCLVSTTAFYLVRFITNRFVKRMPNRGKLTWVKTADKHFVFHRATWFVPLLIVYGTLPLLSLTQLPFMEMVTSVAQTLTVVAIIVTAVMSLTAFLNSIDDGYKSLTISNQYSIKSYIQVIKIIIYLFAAILIISALMNKSPTYLLTGLGAMTAVTMLVFKDSILGFVASIQISAYDIVRVGDWVEMPKFGADGTVIDISLNTIKVRNFDNTIVTIPSYTILSEGVKNWRGMQESGGRRIKRSFFVDVSSIKFCDSRLISKISRISLLRDRMHTMLKKEGDVSEKEVYSEIAAIVNTDHCVTNLSLFRAYLEVYLKSHPKIHKHMTFLIRELQDQGKGIPVELYLFTNDTDWGVYEGIQADIFDHIFAIMPLFDLKPFQHLSGSTLQFEQTEAVVA